MVKDKTKWKMLPKPKKVKVVDASSKQLRKLVKAAASTKNVKPVFVGQRSALDDEISGRFELTQKERNQLERMALEERLGKKAPFCLCTTLNCPHKTFVYGIGIIWHKKKKSK